MANALTKHFFCAGNCTFTVRVPEDFAGKNGCNLHYTFKVEKAEPTERFPKPATFIKLLTGPDNTQDYSYLGMLNEETGEVRLTQRSCVGETAWAVRIIRRVFGQMWEGEGCAAIERAGWHLHHEGRCGRCGRPLTVPESLEVGIGPDCAEKMGIDYPTRTKPKKERKPRVSKKAAVAVPVEIDPASYQEPAQLEDHDHGPHSEDDQFVVDF